MNNTTKSPRMSVIPTPKTNLLIHIKLSMQRSTINYSSFGAKKDVIITRRFFLCAFLSTFCSQLHEKLLIYVCQRYSPGQGRVGVIMRCVVVKINESDCSL